MTYVGSLIVVFSHHHWYLLSFVPYSCIDDGADSGQMEYLVKNSALEDSLSQSCVELGQTASLLADHVFSYGFRSKT